MALTYLKSQMIDVPLSVPTLSARTLQSPSATFVNATVTYLSANNYYASSIFNDTDLFGDLTVHGNITSLSGFNIVSTFATTTSSLSVVNTGLGRALDITQYSNTDGIASFKGNNGEVVRINNNNPDVGLPGVSINWSGSGPALSAQGTSSFNIVNTENINNTNAITTNSIVATDCTFNNLNVTRVSKLQSISATNTVTDNIIFPSTGGNIINGTTFYGNLNVIGVISSISAIQVATTGTTTTSALSVINSGSIPAIFVKQQANTNGIVNFTGANDVSVLRVNNTLPNIGQDAVRILTTSTGNTFVAGNSANPSSTAFVITSAGNVGIGVLAPTTALQVNGNVTATTFIGNLQGTATGVSDNTINALKLTDNAVLANKITDLAVTTGKINDLAVTTEKINSQAVTTEKLALSAVTTATINNGAVTTEKLALSAVTTATINNGAVTPSKLSAGGPIWDTSGNLGIGTSSPAYKLDVNGNQRNKFASGTGAGMWLDTALSASRYFVGSDAALEAYRVWDSVAGQQRLLIDSSGNVGIGTGSPTAKLQVNGAGQTTAAISTVSNLGGSVYVQDSGGSSGNGGAIILGALQGAFTAIKALITDGASNTVGDLAFSTRNTTSDATLTERLRITATGTINANGNPITSCPTTCKAWVNFDGDGPFSPNPSTTKIRSKYNVSSITRHGEGDYTVSFTTAMTNANYSAVVTGGNLTGATASESSATYNHAVGSVKISTYVAQSAAATDRQIISLQIFGD